LVNLRETDIYKGSVVCVRRLRQGDRDGRGGRRRARSEAEEKEED